MKIFISSTSKDLIEHRAAVLKIVQESNQLPIAMESFWSKPGSALAESLAAVQASDLFIGIYAHRYGYRPEDDKSVTEMEYLEARQKGIPIFVFIVDPEYQHPLIQEHAEQDEESLVLLKGFKRRLERDHIRVLFTSPQDLAEKVTKSLLSWYSQALDAAQHAESTGDKGVHIEIKDSSESYNFSDNEIKGNNNVIGNLYRPNKSARKKNP